MFRRLNVTHFRTSTCCILPYPMNRVVRIRTQYVGASIVKRKRFADKLQSASRVCCEYDRISWRCAKEGKNGVARFVGVR